MQFSPTSGSPPGQMIPSQTKWRRAFLALLALGLLLRVAAAVYMGDKVVPLPGIWDQVSYDRLAWRVVTGHGLSFEQAGWPFTRAGEPTAHWSFLYTGYLAAVYAAVGHHPLAARLLQALLTAVLGPWLAWRLGNRLFRIHGARGAPQPWPPAFIPTSSTTAPP